MIQNNNAAQSSTPTNTPYLPKNFSGKNLSINPSEAWWKNYNRERSIIKFVTAFPIAGKVCNWLGNRLLRIADLQKSENYRLKFRNLLKESVKDQADANQTDGLYGYEDETKEIFTVIKYHLQLKDPRFDKLPSEAPVLYKEQLKTLPQLFKNDPSIQGMFNFGVCYGYVDAECAKQFPEKKFLGIDRSPYVKEYNDHFLGENKNMNFFAGNVFDVLKKDSLKDYIFFTSRTLVCLPTGFVRKLFSEARNSGVKYIVGFEQFGVSRQLGRAFDFEKDRESVSFREFMYLHNYPLLMSEAGYETLECELFETGHPHEDFRILRFVGKLRE